MNTTYRAAYSGAADMLPYAGVGTDGNHYYCLVYPFTLTSNALISANILSSGINSGGNGQVVARVSKNGASQAENSRTYSGIGGFSASSSYIDNVEPGNTTISLCWGGNGVTSPVMTSSISVIQ